MFATGKIKGCIGECLGQIHVTQHIVAGDGFLHPFQVEWPVVLNVLLGLGHTPELVGIHHQLAIRPDRIAHELYPLHILLGILADLQFEGIESFRL